MELRQTGLLQKIMDNAAAQVPMTVADAAELIKIVNHNAKKLTDVTKRVETLEQLLVPKAANDDDAGPTEEQITEDYQIVPVVILGRTVDGMVKA